MEFMARAWTVCVARVRPSGRVSEVNSTSALCKGVKSPLRIALTRCHRPTDRTRLTVPCATVPAGTTPRAKAKTGSRTFASTGAPSRLGRRLVKYTRNGAPGGTLIEIFRLSSSAKEAAETETAEMPATRKPRAIPIAHLLGLIISPLSADGAKGVEVLNRFGGGGQGRSVCSDRSGCDSEIRAVPGAPDLRADGGDLLAAD